MKKKKEKKDLVMNADGAAELGFPMWPQFAEESLEAIQEPLKNGLVNYWTGPKGMEFESKFAQWEGAEHAISCTNGTSALHIAVTSLGIGPGDEVIVPSYSFIASSFCVVQAGAVPVFADVTEDHTLDPDDLESRLTERTKGIIVVHLYGVVADMGSILEFAKKHNLYVIEDCAQSIGGKYKGKKVGTVGDVGCFSFCQSKQFTTGGEGGMVVTNNEALAWECRSIRDHGYNVKERLNLLAMEEKLPYIHDRVGYNFRMTEIQSIIGINELKRYDSWNLARRLEYASMYDQAFTGLKGIYKLPVHTEERQNSYWWYPILLDLEVLDANAEQICNEVVELGIPAHGILWPEAYEERAYKELNGFGTAKFPFFSKEYTNPKSVDYKSSLCTTAKSLREKTLCLFLHPSWEKHHIQRCIDALQEVLKRHYR